MTYNNFSFLLKQTFHVTLFVLFFGYFLVSCDEISSPSPSISQNKDSLSYNSKNISYINLPDPLPVSKEESKRIQTICSHWFDTVLNSKGFNGGILIAKNGNIIFEKYNGTGHIPGNDVITENTPMHIASTSKTFTAMAVLKLWQDGLLNIDDKFNKYFPEFNYDGITIRDLLDHRSGLPNYTHFLENMGWDKNLVANNNDVLKFLITRKLEMENVEPPNTHFNYCNTNFALLALLIEKISNKKYATYLNETFFEPLQMKHTFVCEDSLKSLPSYDWKARSIAYNFLDGVYGDKNIYTTPRDLLIWDRALKSKKIFTEKTLDEAYKPYSNEKPGIKNYGLGWRMNIYPDGKKMIFHNGWWHGSNACFIRLLKENATIIAIGNKFNRSIYGAKILSNIFGDYYTAEEDDENDANKPIDSLQIKNLPHKETYKEQNSRMENKFRDKNQEDLNKNKKLNTIKKN